MATAVAPTPKWVREYETIYILRPNVEAERQEKIAERATGVIERLGGTLTKLDNWGTRRLAYPIRKHTRGLFVHLKFVGYGELVSELERNLRLLDEVVRFQTILLQEEVDPASIEVDPEELKYLHLEDDTEEEEPAVQRARSIGMTPEGEVQRPSEPGPSPAEGGAALADAEQPAEEQPAEEAPAEGAPAEEAPAEGAPAEGAPAADEPEANASADEDAGGPEVDTETKTEN